MITAPKCKVCGNAHWGTCYTPPERAAKRAVPPAADAQLEGGKRAARLGRKATAPASQVSAVPDGGSTSSPSKRGRKPTGFDKKAYDRETARARRAAKKEAKPK